MQKISQGCGMLALAGALAGMGIAPALAQTDTEIVLHNLGTPPSSPRGMNPYAGVICDSAGNLYGTSLYGGTYGAGVVYKLDTAGHQTILYSFTGGADGRFPYAGVIRDPAGNLYGTTSVGGAADFGVVYKLNKAGQYTVLYSFTGGYDGANPQAGVIRDSAGNLYGTTQAKGAYAYGIVYELSTAGQLTVLYNFTDGRYPISGVIRDAAGNLYGTTPSGGNSSPPCGTVYKLDTTGQETVLHNFSGYQDGGDPQSGLIADSTGNLYGTATTGGTFNAGVVYMLDPAGLQTVLYSFTGGADGGQPIAGVIRDSAGNLYGTAYSGGTWNAGVLYKLDPAGQQTVLYSFAGGPDGLYPEAGVIADEDGTLYGTTHYGGSADAGGVVYKLAANGDYTVLYRFPGTADGSFARAGLIGDLAGNLYGTSSGGGSAEQGAVYKLDAAGKEMVLHSFAPYDGGGAGPYGGVIRDSAGNLYGTAMGGGTGGVVYMLDTANNYTVLYNFKGGTDGSSPESGVIRDPAGNLYGTTVYGGTANEGVVYRVDPAGQETVLYSFTGGADGGRPYAGVIRDSAGNLYGTNYGGFTSGYGVVYKLDTAGNLTVLHSFTGGTDGGFPYAGVIRDSAGNLYGTTFAGGSTANAGVVYKLDPTGRQTVLYTFTGGSDGGWPWAGVIRDSAGNLYGTTYWGGPAGAGVVYKLDTAGQETALYAFTGGADGAEPFGGVIRDPAGNLYGATSSGGEYGDGVVFKIEPQ
jgi:uncharacterized repeat protein (TIGR03803 family)